eukprot:784259-Prymnesium_polylepis.1
MVPKMKVPITIVLPLVPSMMVPKMKVAVARVDEDADHDRVAGGADHDAHGADEGADARLVGADRVVGRLVVSSDDALRC